MGSITGHIPTLKNSWSTMVSLWQEVRAVIIISEGITTTSDWLQSLFTEKILLSPHVQ